jgi:hypothetical protein
MESEAVTDNQKISISASLRKTSRMTSSRSESLLIRNKIEVLYYRDGEAWRSSFEGTALTALAGLGEYGSCKQ